MANLIRSLYNYNYNYDNIIGGYNRDLNESKISDILSKIEKYYSFKHINNTQITNCWWEGVNHSFNLEKLKQKLPYFYTCDITTGFSITMFEDVQTNLSRDTEKWIIESTIDLIIRLCSLENIISICGHDHMTDEYRDFKINRDILVDLLKKLELTSKIDTSPPNKFGGNNFGLVLDNKNYNWIHLSCLYPLLVIKKFIELHKLNVENICEIGGGLGYLCYYFIKNTNYNYTLIDLTNANIAQTIMLNSEFDNSTIGRVRLINSLVEDINEIDCDIIINQDSFAEMSKEIIINYIKKIKKKTYLFSFNQESLHNDLNVCTSKILLESDEIKIKRLSRHPSFYRSGYIDEVYLINY